MFKRLLGEGKNHTLRIAELTLILNILLGIGKLAVGIFSRSFFVCVSGFYTFGMAAAKCFALSGIIKSKTEKQQRLKYKLTAATLIIASLIYIGYSTRLFFYPQTGEYSIYTGLLIAAFTFTELVLNIRGVILERKSNSPLFHALKTVSLASTLICLVLTQTAILSFADPQLEAQPAANGLMGVLMGTAAMVLGILMLVRGRRLEGQLDTDC